MSYDVFANYYDALQSDIDYAARTEYLLELFGRYDRAPSLLLDLACGTGGFSLCFAKKGVEVVGVDPSCGMLSKAREKFSKEGLEALFVCQKAEELDLFGTVDGAVCCLDSLNHITDGVGIERAFERVSLFLEPGRLFIFDLNTEYKHKHVLSGNTFCVQSGDVFCVWRASPCAGDGTLDICLDFFEKQSDGRYARSTEEFSERAYREDFIDGCIGRAGLEKLAVLGDMSFYPPKANEERVIYVTRKV